MNVGGTAAVLWLCGVILIAWIFDLVRRDRLYVGYGVIFVCAIAAGLVTIVMPRLLAPVGRLWTSAFPVSGFFELVVLFVFVLLIYAFSQLTLFSNRLTTLIQELAIRDAEGPPQPASGSRER